MEKPRREGFPTATRQRFGLGQTPRRHRVSSLSKESEAGQIAATVASRIPPSSDDYEQPYDQAESISKSRILL